jgi:hypothetical protein
MIYLHVAFHIYKLQWLIISLVTIMNRETKRAYRL